MPVIAFLATRVPFGLFLGGGRALTLTLTFLFRFGSAASVALEFWEVEGLSAFKLDGLVEAENKGLLALAITCNSGYNRSIGY